jgi:hypothetical protein
VCFVAFRKGDSDVVLGRTNVDRSLPLRLNKECYKIGPVSVYVCHVSLHSFSAIICGKDVSSVLVLVCLCAHSGWFISIRCDILKWTDKGGYRTEGKWSETPYIVQAAILFLHIRVS